MVKLKIMNQRKSDVSFSTRHFGTATVTTSTYQNGNAIAVELVDQTGEPMAVLSVNIPNSAHLLGKGEFFAKTWSENEAITKDALASGIFRDTGRRNDGDVEAPIWAFK